MALIFRCKAPITKGLSLIHISKALNALNPEVLADLKAAFEAIDQNAVRCVVLTGAGDKLSLIHISFNR